MVVLAMVPALQFRGWQWVSLALAAPVAVWGTWPFHRAAVASARHRAATMDTLISVRVTAAFGWSLYALPAKAVAEVIPASRFLPVEGTLTGEDLKEAFVHAYRKSSGRLGRWFLDSPVHDEDRTWVVTKMWGTNTEPVLQRLVHLAPPQSGIRYEPVP